MAARADVDDIAAWLHRLRAVGIDPEEVEFGTTAEGMEMSFGEIRTIMRWLGRPSGHEGAHERTRHIRPSLRNDLLSIRELAGRSGGRYPRTAAFDTDA